MPTWILLLIIYVSYGLTKQAFFALAIRRWSKQLEAQGHQAVIEEVSMLSNIANFVSVVLSTLAFPVILQFPVARRLLLDGVRTAAAEEYPTASKEALQELVDNTGF